MKAEIFTRDESGYVAGWYRKIEGEDISVRVFEPMVHVTAYDETDKFVERVIVPLDRLVAIFLAADYR
jgi:hypothetical protein